MKFDHDTTSLKSKSKKRFTPDQAFIDKAKEEFFQKGGKITHLFPEDLESDLRGGTRDVQDWLCESEPSSLSFLPKR